MKKITLEICVDSVASVLAAARGGADRIELCSALSIGGLSPSIELLERVRPLIDIDIYAMVRPREGDFIYDDHEFEMMKAQIKRYKTAGANGVVFGILTPEGEIDTERIRELVKLARPMNVTFHRAFDMTKDPFQSMEKLKKLGVNRILTSGLKDRAIDGIELISLLAEDSGNLSIMPGGGVNIKNAKEFISLDNVTEIHMSAKKLVKSKMSYRNTYINMGTTDGDEFSLFQTDETIVRNVRLLLDKHE